MTTKVKLAVDLNLGQVVRPFLGVYFAKAIDSLDWRYTLEQPFWDHVVTAITAGDDATITFARPMAFASEFTRQPYLTAEVYTMPLTTDRPFRIMTENLKTV